MYRRLLPALILGATLAPTTSAAAFSPGTTTLLDRPSGLGAFPPAGMTESLPGRTADMSADGRYVAFTSGADGLSTTDDDRQDAVWLRDRTQQTTTRVSTTTAGLEDVSVSDDGDRVCFGTRESLAAGDTDAQTDVYVKDMSDGSVMWASRASDGTNRVDGVSQCAISGNGAHVTFATSGALEGAHVTNQIYRHTLATGTTTLVSRADGAAGALANSTVAFPEINGDGDVVVFTANATNLDGGDANGTFQDVFVRRVSTNDTRAVSTIDGSATQEGNSGSGIGTISADGDEVAFHSIATNLVAAGDGVSDSDIYRKRLSTEQVVLVSRADGAAGAKATNSSGARISPDGGSVAFESQGANLDPAVADPGSDYDTYIRRGLDTATPTTTFVSRASGAGGAEAESTSAPIAVSTDGDQVLFETSARNLSNDGAEDFSQLFVRRLTGSLATEPVIRPTGAPGAFPSNQAYSDLGSQGRHISDDGRFVVFISEADALSADDDNRWRNAFVRDNVTHQTTLVGRADGAAGAAPNEPVFDVAISGDGRRVAFGTSATNLGGDATFFRGKVYVRDLVAQTTTLASVSDDGTPANASALTVGIDGDGSRVVFETGATNMADGDTDAVQDIHVRDLATGDTLLASRADDGTKPAQGGFGPWISADGNRVAFTTSAASMANGDTDFSDDVHVRDLAAGRTLWASRPDGAGAGQSDDDAGEASISADGNRVAFATGSTNLGDGDADSVQDVHVRDFATSRTILVSRASGTDGVKGAASSGTPQLSSDGTAVVFESTAKNLTADTGSSFDAAFLRRLDTNETVLVGRADGAAGAPLALVNDPNVNSDGSCVAFEGMFGSALLTPDGASPDFPHVLLRTVRKTCPLPAATGGGNGGGGGGNAGGGGTPAAPTPAPTPGVTPPLPLPPRRTTPPVLPRLDPAKVLKLPKACTSRRRFRIKLALPAGARVSSVTATINRKRAKTTRKGANVDLRGLPKGRIAIAITVKLADGRTVTTTRRYRTCAPAKRKRG